MYISRTSAFQTIYDGNDVNLDTIVSKIAGRTLAPTLALADAASPYQPADGSLIRVDTTALTADFVINLPDLVGEVEFRFGVADIGGNAQTRRIVVNAGAGSQIRGAQTLVLDQDYGVLEFFYNWETQEWVPYEYSYLSLNKLDITGAAGSLRGITYKSDGISRWDVVVGADAEAGANSGSDFIIRAYDDAGALLAQALRIDRATAETTVVTLSVADAAAVGAGLTVGGAGVFGADVVVAGTVTASGIVFPWPAYTVGDTYVTGQYLHVHTLPTLFRVKTGFTATALALDLGNLTPMGDSCKSIGSASILTVVGADAVSGRYYGSGDAVAAPNAGMWVYDVSIGSAEPGAESIVITATSVPADPTQPQAFRTRQGYYVDGVWSGWKTPGIRMAMAMADTGQVISPHTWSAIDFNRPQVQATDNEWISLGPAWKFQPQLPGYYFVSYFVPINQNKSAGVLFKHQAGDVEPTPETAPETWQASDVADKTKFRITPAYRTDVGVGSNILRDYVWFWLNGSSDFIRFYARQEGGSPTPILGETQHQDFPEIQVAGPFDRMVY